MRKGVPYLPLQQLRNKELPLTAFKPQQLSKLRRKAGFALALVLEGKNFWETVLLKDLFYTLPPTLKNPATTKFTPSPLPTKHTHNPNSLN